MKLITTLGPLVALVGLVNAQAMAPGAAPPPPAGAPAAGAPAAGAGAGGAPAAGAGAGAPAAAPAPAAPAAGAPAAGAPAAGAPAAPAAPAASSSAPAQPSAPAVVPGTALGAGAAQLVGTWSSKSNAVFTGPDFYDPVDELLIEPALPGMSYSFTEDGFFEEAIYQVEANPRDPTCPTAVLIFQHGKYEVLSNNSIVLHPFDVDGRQLLSDPCNSTSSSQSVYSRYNQTEFFKSWQVYVDEFWGRYRLDLFQFDGSPLPPFYLSYKPPMMLPTITMNPTAAAGETGSSSKKTKRTVGAVERIRRSLENRSKTKAVKVSDFDFNALWWTGVGLMSVGAAGWYMM